MTWFLVFVFIALWFWQCKDGREISEAVLGLSRPLLGPDPQGHVLEEVKEPFDGSLDIGLPPSDLRKHWMAAPVVAQRGRDSRFARGWPLPLRKLNGAVAAIASLNARVQGRGQTEWISQALRG